jgi:SAM-dependent methyltransferase
MAGQRSSGPTASGPLGEGSGSEPLSTAAPPVGPPALGDFLGEPTRDLARWRWLWEGDRPFPIRSHRGLLGPLLVAAKKLLRPLVKVPQNDLWERQRVFNLLLLEWLGRRDDDRLAERLGNLEGALPERLGDVLRHNDALFARLDQKVDLYRREARDLLASLGGALAALAPGERRPEGEDAAGVAPREAGAPRRERLARAFKERGYFELERRFRGTEAEIGERLASYLETLRGHGPVLDLGCGRGEALALFAAHGIEARGVDGSAAMVAHCRERGLCADQGDLLEHLAATEAGSVCAVVSFHVVEHLPAGQAERLTGLAYRALAPGGVLILETPNPLSLVVAARNFWLDPTHRRPVHPEALMLGCRLAGFDPVERRDLRPFAVGERLPEIELSELPEEARALAHQVNALRDRLDELLFGFQDYAIVAEKPRP